MRPSPTGVAEGFARRGDGRAAVEPCGGERCEGSLALLHPDRSVGPPPVAVRRCRIAAIPATLPPWQRSSGTRLELTTRVRYFRLMVNLTRTPRRVVLVAFPWVLPVDLAGPADVFDEASQLVEGAYSIEVVARSRRPIGTRSGLSFVPDTTFARCQGGIDTLIVPGGPGCEDAENDRALVAWLRSAAPRSRRVASVCGGAFVLAAAGLLDGRRVTTHWDSCDTLALRYPKLIVERDPIYIEDGDVWTSAGGTAGIDLALALVERDLGREVALKVAQWLVVFFQRPGGQAQFSSILSSQLAERRPLRELQAWIVDSVAEDLRVEMLAERCSMSPRNFARAFRRETGVTPAAFVERARVERARQRLEQSDDPIDVVADTCGFGSVDTMRRAFARQVGIPPANYRAHFQRAAAAGGWS
jgi:transcriptional regulator GlxA family with amidase domain